MVATHERPRRAVVIEPRELEQMLRGQTETLSRHLLPNGVVECGYFQVGSITGEKGQSLKVNMDGPLRGVWTDFSAAKGTPEYSGDMLWLIARVKFGGRLSDAISWAISWLGLDGLDPARLATERATAAKKAAEQDEDAARKAEKMRQKALGLYLSAKPLPGTPAERYLISRGIDLRALGLEAPGSLKFHPRAWCTEVKRELPALIAGVVDLEGRHIATHRTWLRSDGLGKAELVEPKKAMGKYQGGFIPLWKGKHKVAMGKLPAGTPVLCSEGIEDGLTAAIARPEHRVIAGISLSNIGGVRIAPGCPLIILAQRDEAGSKAVDALEAAIARQQAAGVEVRLSYPPAGAKDINDALQGPDDE